LGDSLEVADASTPEPKSAPVAPIKPIPAIASAGVIPAAMRQRETASSATTETRVSVSARPISLDTPVEGTVVLDVEQGGIVVPSFAGKSVRSAIEIAEESGLDLDAVGSGIAREQSPTAGSHVAAGSRVTVRFGR
jgi:cell division protein FtsI (penicillin-binding protein 3)